MTTPLIQSDESNLDWQTITNRNIQNRTLQGITDAVKPPADQLGYDTFYNTINNIRQSSQIATEGQIAADNTRRAREAAQAAAAREAARQKALQDAAARMRGIASGGTFGQPDWKTYPLTGFSPGSGPSSTYNGDDASIADLMRAAGFPEDQIGIGLGIVAAESGGLVSASHYNPNGSVDRGLWQINSVHDDLLNGRDIFDPFVNTLIAKQVWDAAGGSWTPWTTFGTPQAAPHEVPPPRNVTIPPYPANTGATGLRMTIVNDAMAYLGVPYEWGGESSSGVDCSGLVYRAYADAGIPISRTTANDYSLGGGGINGQRTTLDQLLPGDLVAWSHNRSGESPNFVGHIAVYAGNGEIIEALDVGIPVHRVKISNYDWLIGIHVNLPGD